jgi:hypothetical protein
MGILLRGAGELAGSTPCGVVAIGRPAGHRAGRRSIDRRRVEADRPILIMRSNLRTNTPKSWH